MMTMWHIRVAPPTDVSDTNPVNVEEAVLAEVDATRTELQGPSEWECEGGATRLGAPRPAAVVGLRYRESVAP